MTQIGSLREQAAQQAQEVTGILNTLNASSTALNTEISGLREAIGALASEMSVDAQGNRTHPNSEKIAALEAKVNSLTSQIETLNQTIETTKARIAEIQNEETRLAMEESLAKIEKDLNDQTRVLAHTLGLDPNTLEYNSQGLGAFTGLEVLGAGNIPSGIENLGTVFKTSGGFYISTDVASADGHQVKIYDENGKEISFIAGDPHVDENQDGQWDWHFGDDSYFVLPDGTEILFNTKEISDGVFITKGLQIKDGSQLGTVGLGLDDATMLSTQVSNTNSNQSGNYSNLGDKADGAAVFAWSDEANNGRGGWAVLQDDNKFYDVADESWEDYLANKSFQGQTTGNALDIQFDDGHMDFILDNLDTIADNLDNIGESINNIGGDINKVSNTLADAIMNKAIATETILEMFKENYRSFEKYMKSLEEADKQQIINSLVERAKEIQGRTDLTDDQKSNLINDLVTMIRRIPTDNPPSLGGLTGGTDTQGIRSVSDFSNLVSNGATTNQQILDTYSGNYRGIEKSISNDSANASIEEIIRELNSRIEDEEDEAAKKNLTIVRDRVIRFSS